MGLPHTKTGKEFISCAYTQKVLNFCKMMKSLGHEVFHYGCDGSDNGAFTEHITTVTDEQRQKWFGGNDWKKEFYSVEYDLSKPYWQEKNKNDIAEIKKRIQDRDFICVIAGVCQKPIADAFPDNMTVEYGIGYEGIFSKYKIFESYAWMHYLYGQRGIANGESFDSVIPNYFDPADFPLQTAKDGYALFVGRLIPRKGIEEAAEACQKAGIKLIVAGQGGKTQPDGKIAAPGLNFGGQGVEYIGTVDVKARGQLMAGARALLAPTRYIGPFEGVSVEALFCGTPVITTDWGSFAENNLHGKTGYRCRTMGEMIFALQNLNQLWEPERIRDYAVSNFTMDVVKFKYEAYFEQLLQLWDNNGYYSSEVSKHFITRYK